MGRRKLYHTAEEKLAANRTKSKKHYEKKAEVINAKRRKKYKRNKVSITGKEKKSVLVALPNEQVGDSEETAEEKLVKRIKFFMFKAGNIERLLNELTGDQPWQFANSICLKYLESGEKDDIHKQVVKLGKLQRRIVRCQDEILQLAGIGKEWNTLTKIAEEVRQITGWVEEIFCHAIVHYSEVERMYQNSELAYQAYS